MDGVERIETGTEGQPGRLSALSEAILRINQSLELDRVRQAVIDSACELTGARHGGIATIDDAGKLESFITSGLSDEEHQKLIEEPATRRLLENVDGSPVTLEGQTPLYRWGGRVSVYTGLPGVVGWEWHQIQQRGVHGREVSRRVDDVDTIYSTRSTQEAERLLRKYDVSYVYVGQLERLYYPEAGISKFEDGMAGVLERVYAGELATIYWVVR